VGEIVRYDEYRASFIDVDVEEEFSDKLGSFEDVLPVAEETRRLDYFGQTPILHVQLSELLPILDRR
jgi:hypothetical protein